VLRGETDVAVAHESDLLPRPLDPLFERRQLLADNVLLALPADHPLAAPADDPLATGGPVALSALAGQPFLAPRESTSCAEMIQRVSRRGGDRKPAVRVVLDALTAEAAHCAAASPAAAA
jgi:DNA-binding transcriptional LysR family regulator